MWSWEAPSAVAIKTIIYVCLLNTLGGGGGWGGGDHGPNDVTLPGHNCTVIPRREVA